MAEYVCRLGTPEGKTVEKVYSAHNEMELREDFENKGLYVFNIREKSKLSSLLSLASLRSRTKISTSEFILFNHELCTLLKAGMPIVASLDILLEKMENPVFKDVLMDVREQIKSGTALSEAFGSHPKHFPVLYSASIKAGERSGDLENVIRRFISYLKIVSTIKKQAMSGMYYPVILLCLSSGVIAVLVTYVIPRFSEFYAGFDATLPLSTKILLMVASTLRHYLWAVALLLIGAFVLIRRSVTSALGRRIFDRWKLKIPFLGKVWLKYSLSQFTRALATLLGGGIPLLNSLEIAAGAVGNSEVAGATAGCASNIKQGESLSKALEDTRLVTHMVVEMVKVGESTGSLKEMLNSVADYYDEEITRNVETLVSLIEPLILIVMGFIIAGILLSMYLPLFSLMNVVQ